jgi:signal peptidase II
MNTPLSAMSERTIVRDRPALFFVLSLLVFVLDQSTKHIIRVSVGLSESIPVTPFFDIVHVRNTGSAFGLFRGLGNVFFIVVSFAAIVVVAALLVKNGADRLGLALILGGAGGNVADRIAYGYVTDFLDLFIGRHHWPAFNVADSALTVGMVLLVVTSFGRSSADKVR